MNAAYPVSPSLSLRLRERLEPRAPYVMSQRWRRLLFLHWPVDPGLVAETLPPGLFADTYDGKAWIGLVPFRMVGVRPRYCPALPGISGFPELNLRTYVLDSRGRPGVWFYSLDTPCGPANWIARRFFHLNYQRAEMSSHTSEDQRTTYRSRREGSSVQQTFVWTPGESKNSADPESLEFFLAERYRLFAYDWRRERLYTGTVHHSPYPLQSVRVEEYSDELFALNGLPRPERPPESILASPGVDVRIYPLSRVD